MHTDFAQFRYKSARVININQLSAQEKTLLSKMQSLILIQW